MNRPGEGICPCLGVNAVAVSGDGKMAAGACNDGSIKLWTTADGKQAGNFAGHPERATGSPAFT